MLKGPAIAGKGGIAPTGSLRRGSPRPDILYHGIPVDPAGTHIRASTGYGTSIPDELHEELGTNPTATERLPLVFATPHLTHAIGYTLTRGEWLLMSRVPGSENYFAIVCEREHLMTRPRTGRVLSFSSDAFAAFPDTDDHYVSAQAVPFEDTTRHAFTSTYSMMEAGLQILSCPGEIWASAASALRGRFDEVGLYQAMREAVASGDLVWENLRTGAGPDPKLAELLEVNLDPTTTGTGHNDRDGFDATKGSWTSRLG